MEDDRMKIQIKYNDEIKTIDFPITLEDLIIDFKKNFHIKDKTKYFNFSYTVDRFIHKKNFEAEIKVLQKRQNPLIFAEDSCKDFLELLNKNTSIESEDEQNEKEIEIKEDDIFNIGKTTITLKNDEDENENKIDEKNDKVDLKENINLLENEIKKTKDEVNNEINNVNVLKEELYFLDDISKDKIPKQYIQLKNKLEKIEKENEEKSKEIKELNKLNLENIRLKNIIEAKNNTIKNMEKSYKKAINDLKDNFLRKIKELEENSTNI